MTRIVFCKKHKQELPGLDLPPLPGAVGQDIFDNVSKQAWDEWMKHQTMIINEKQLNLMEKQTRTYLLEQMKKFFSGEEFDKAEGYVPVDK